MATYRISGPDGKTYQVEGPPGATRDDIIREIKRQQGIDANTYGSDNYVYKSEDTNYFEDVKDNIVSVAAGIPKAVGGIVSLGSYIPGVKTIADPLAKGLMKTGDFIDDALLSDRQKELNEELSARLQEAAGTLGPDASISDYVDALLSQGGEAGQFIIENPGQAINLVAQSLPYIWGGGLVGTGVAAGAKGTAFLASKFGLSGTAKVADKVGDMGLVTRRAVGEGGISMGANVQQAIAEKEAGGEELNMLDRYKTVPSGIITGLVGYTGARYAQRAGLRDVDLLLGGKNATVGVATSSGSKLANIAKGTLIEGSEEFLQSAGEKAGENWALDKNLLTDIGGETVLGTVAGITQGGIVNTIRQTPNIKIKTPKVPEDLQEELREVKENNEEEIVKQTNANEEFVQGATAVETPEDLVAFAAQQGVTVEELQANPEFQAIQEEKALVVQEKAKRAQRTKHAKTFPNEKDWVNIEKEYIYQDRRAEISNPETELGVAFDAWAEDDAVVFEGKLDRDEVTGNPSEIAVKGFIKDNPSLFDNTLPSTYKTALEEHAALQEEKLVDPNKEKQLFIILKEMYDSKVAALEDGDLQRAAAVEADAVVLSEEDPMFRVRWNEFKRTQLEALDNVKKPKKKTAAATDTVVTPAETAEQAAAELAALQQAEEIKNKEDIASFSTLAQEDFVPGSVSGFDITAGTTPRSTDTFPGPVEATTADKAAAGLVVEPSDESKQLAKQAAESEQKVLEFPKSDSRIGTKKRTRFDEAQVEFARPGQSPEENHPELFKAIEDTVLDENYAKKLEKARETQKLLDEASNITGVGARTSGDFDMPQGQWQEAIITVLEKASARGNLGDYITFKPYIQHTVGKNETRKKVAEKYGLPVEIIFGKVLTDDQLDKEMQNKTFKTAKEKTAYLESINRVEKRTQVRGTGIGKSNPARYTVKYPPIKQKQTLKKGTEIQIPMSKTVMAALPIEEKYKAAEFQDTAIAEEVINANAWAKNSTPERGRKNVNFALESYRKKHIQVGNATNNPRETMIRFMERTAFAEAYTGSDTSNQQVEDYKTGSAYVEPASNLEERPELLDKQKVADLSSSGVSVKRSPGDFKAGTTDDFQSKQELRVLEAALKDLKKASDKAEKKAKESQTRGDIANATRKKNLLDTVSERITEIKNFQSEDKDGKVRKQRIFNEKDSLPAGQPTPETLAQAEIKNKERTELARKILENPEQKTVMSDMWDNNRTTSFDGKVTFVPTFDKLTTAHQRLWVSKVLLAVKDDALPDIRNQQRLMEDRINEDYTESKTESKEVVDGRGQTDTAESKPKLNVRSDRTRNIRSVSSKNKAENYAKEKLAPIYGPRWRGHSDLAILKTHLKNKDFSAYQRIVDKRVEESSTKKKPIQVEAIINGEEKILKIYQPDLFDKTQEANKESTNRFDVLFRKLIGQKDYDKIKQDRIFYYETTDDMLKAGWKGEGIEEAAAWVVPAGMVDTGVKTNAETQMVFIMEKIKPGDELQIFIHEVGVHVGIEGVLTKEGAKKLAKRIQKLYEEDLAKYGNEDFYTDTMEQALQRYPIIRADSEAHFMARHAMRNALSPGYRDRKTGKVPEDTLQSESIAFFVQAAIAIGADPTDATEVGRILKKFVDAIKKFLNIVVGNTEFNMSANDVATMAWGAGRLKLKGGSEFTRMMAKISALQTAAKGKFKMSIKDWSNSIDAAVRRNYPKNAKGKYVPYDGSFVKDWSTYQKETYKEAEDYRSQSEAQAEAIIKQAEEHERSMFEPGEKKPKRSFSFNRPPLNTEEKTRSEKESSRIRDLIVFTTGSEEAGYQYDTVANLASNAIDSTKFLHEYAYENRTTLPSGMILLNDFDQAELMRNNIKQTVDDIAIQARDLTIKRQVIIDRIIAFGTQEQLWPADPGMDNKSVANGNVVINKKFAKVFTDNLNEAEQKIVMDIYRHGEKMMALKRAILTLLGLAEDSTFLGLTSLDGPYAALRRTGSHTVILKSKTYVELEKLLDQSSESTSTVKKKDLKTKLDNLQTDPKHYSYSYFRTKGEAQKYLDDEIATGKWDTSNDGSTYTPRAETVGQGREPDKKVFDKVLAAMGTSELDPASKAYVEGLLNKMYMESMEETNARQGEGKRKGRGVAGFDSTMISSFVDNAKSEANLLANMRYGKAINVSISNTRAEAVAANDPKVMEVYNMFVVHYNLMLTAKDTSIMNSIASFTTAMVLTTSLGYHLQNATQPWAVSYPILAGDFNDWKAITPAMARGYRIASSLITYDGKIPVIQWNKPATWQTEVNLEQIPTWVTHKTKFKATGNLTGRKRSKPEMEKRLKMWNEVIKPLLVAMQEAKLIDLGIEQDLSNTVSLKPSGFATLDKAMVIGGKVSHTLYQLPRYVEAYNRIATGIAAIELATNHRNSAKVLKAYDATPTSYAVRLVRRTQGDFTSLDAPAVIKYFTNTVPAGKLMVQFKKFGILMGWAHVTAWKQARKGLSKEEKAMGRRAAAYLLSHTLVLSGVRGLPFISYFTLLTFLLGTGEDDDYDPNDTEGVIERKLMEMFPDNLDFAKGVARGPFNPWLGIDTHTKLSQANTFSLFPFTDFELSSEGFQDLGFALFGATGANALNIGRGFEFMAEGNYYRGIESMIPKGAKSVMESWRLGTEGYTARNGNVGVTPDSFSKFQLILNGLGIPATSIVDLKWTVSEQFQINEFFTKEQAKLKREYKKAFDGKDRNKMNEIKTRFVKLQDGKDRARPFFNNSQYELKRSPLTVLTKAASRQIQSEVKMQKRLGFLAIDSRN